MMGMFRFLIETVFSNDEEKKTHVYSSLDTYMGGIDGTKIQQTVTTKKAPEETKKIVVTKETGAITKTQQRKEYHKQKP